LSALRPAAPTVYRTLSLHDALPISDSGQDIALVRELLDHAVEILQAPRVLMIWEETDKPRLRVASRSDGGFDLSEEPAGTFGPLDRKSTRLDSSHQIISYAVFCLKK